MQTTDLFKIEIFIPPDHVDALLAALAEAGVGQLGNYDRCASITPVTGTWRPLPGADPYDGEVGRQQRSPEAKVEVTSRAGNVRAALQAIRRVHPYEEPVINVIPLVNAWFEGSARRS